MTNQDFPSRPRLWTRWTVFPLFSIGLLIMAANVAQAADPDFVGILAIAADDATAQRLGLSDEAREQIRKLIDDRMKAAVPLALSIKDLPPAEQARRLAPFVEESEKLGMKLLSMDQRSQLNQLRLQRGGMTTLAEPDMTQLLQLSDEQRQEIERLLGQRAVAMTRGGEIERRRARDSYERLLRALLTSEQKATWDQMAGLGPGPAARDASDDVAADTSADVPTEDVTGEAAAEDVAESKMAADDAQPGVEEPKAEEGMGPGEDPESPASPSDVQPVTPPPSDVTEVVDPANVILRFNFRFQPWGDVLDWLAEQADLSLQGSLIPGGTFNYSDTAEYTPKEAIDLINGVLLHQGYTLVRRGRLLTVMDLEEEVPDVLVEFVPVEKLDERGEFEMIKTVFHVARMEPSDAEQEIGQLLGPGRTMVVMPKARQILVTETAGKLRMIRDVIERAENPSGSTDGLVEINLQHIAPEELLGSARNLLGLGEGEDVGDDIAIAQDSTGTRLFANGSREKIEILTNLAEKLDQKREVSPDALALEQPQLRTHPIYTADSTEALAVLQTLLAGLPDVRMSLDAQTSKIIALAPPSAHKTIEETLRQLEGQAPRIEVIQLRRIDPQMAVVAIGNFFSGDAEGESTIKIDADPLSMRLYVRATEAEIAEIKLLIEKLEGPVEGSGGGTLRFIPLDSQSAEDAVATARRLWLEPNEIQFVTPSESGPSLFDLKEINPDPPAERAAPPARPKTMPSTSLEKPDATRPSGTRNDKVTWRRNAGRVGGVPVQFVSFHEDEEADEAQAEIAVPGEAQEIGPQESSSPSVKGADIRIEFTPNGILIASEDTEALDKFESLLRQVAPINTLGPQKNFTVYFLKYCKADVARQLISDILGGSSSDIGGGSLVGDVASNLLGGGGGILGALMGGGGGGGGSAVTTVQGTGTVSLVADARLNCLVVQGMPVDLKLIEQLLKVIDREDSITDIETAGKPHVIQIVYLNAEDVATVIKEAFADRMAQQSSGQRGGQPNPAELIRALRGGGRGGRGSEVQSEAPKMTIAVDAASNSLIVTAPEQLFVQVRDLVYEIDQANSDMAEEVVAVSIRDANPEAVQKALASIMGQSSRSSSRTSSSSSSARPGGFGAGGATAASIQSRVDAFRRMREAGMFGGGGGRPGGTTGFGGRGGGAPSGFGGRGGTPGFGGRGGSAPSIRRGPTGGGRGR